MTLRPEPSSIAFLDSDRPSYRALRLKLQQLGHLPTPFPDASSLQAALAGGQRFDLLVVPPQKDGTQWQRLAAVCEVLGMPLLLVVQPGHRDAPQPLDDVFLRGTVVDLCAADVAEGELDWRIRALLQRAGMRAQNTSRLRDLVLGDYKFFGRQRLVLHRETEIALQPRQFELAYELFRNVGQVVTRGWLWSTLWGRASPREGARALDVCVTNVRKKLDLRRENGFTLRAAYRHGYMLCPVAALPQHQQAAPPDGAQS